MDICDLFLNEVKDQSPRDKWGRTPLHLAADSGHIEVCKILLLMTEDKNPPDDNGITPMDIALEKGHIKLFKVYSAVLAGMPCFFIIFVQ